MKTSTVSGNDQSLPLSVYCCGAMIFILVGRIQEIFTFLQVFRPGLLMLFVTLVLSYSNGRINDTVTGTTEFRLLGLFWLISFVTIFSSVWPGGAMFIWKIKVTTNVLFFLCCLANMKTEKEVLFLTRALIFTVVILCAKILLSPEMSAGARAFATQTYDANDVALVVVVAIPLAMACSLSGLYRAKLNYNLILLILVATLLKTGSRGGFLGFSFISLYFLFSPAWEAGFAKKFFLALITIIFILYLAPESLWERFSALFSGEDYNFTAGEDGDFGRLELWKLGLNLFKDNFFTGVGAGQFSVALGQALGKEYWMTAHNFLIQVAGDLGIVGITIFLAMLAKIKNNLKTAKNTLPPYESPDLFSSLPTFVFISFLAFFACSFLLSQAYSIFIPFFLATSRALVQLSEQKELTLA